MKIIAGNWKMYPKTYAEAEKILSAIDTRITGGKKSRVIVCTPAVYLGGLATKEKLTRVKLGAQDAFWEDEGACTGEDSPVMIASVGAKYVITGHSERRAMGETDEIVAKKSGAAIRSGMSVIMCVGERTRDDEGSYFTEVGNELRSSLAGVPKAKSAQLIIAYEPIWAIGSKAKRAATPRDFHEMSIFIRRHLVDYFGKKAGFAVPILYGGSVDDKNALGFLTEGDADGLLIGRVSLDPEKFSAIVALADAL